MFIRRVIFALKDVVSALHHALEGAFHMFIMFVIAVAAYITAGYAAAQAGYRLPYYAELLQFLEKIKGGM